MPYYEEEVESRDEKMTDICMRECLMNFSFKWLSLLKTSKNGTGSAYTDDK